MVGINSSLRTSSFFFSLTVTLIRLFGIVRTDRFVGDCECSGIHLDFPEVSSSAVAGWSCMSRMLVRELEGRVAVNNDSSQCSGGFSHCNSRL